MIGIMKTKTILLLFGFAILLLTHGAQAGRAASLLTVSSGGDGVFTLQGTAFESVAAMDITLSYDTGTLDNPRVEQGALISGALSAVNLNNPGAVRMAIVRTSPVSGSGIIVTLTFDKKGSSPGKITGLSARLSNLDGKSLASSVQIVNPTDSAAAAAETTTSQEQAESSAASSGSAFASQSGAGVPGSPAGIGVIIAPGAGESGTTAPAGEMETAEKKEEPAQETGAAPAEEPEMTALKTGDEAVSLSRIPDRTLHTHKGVLDRFREYSGERSPKSLMSLFELDSIIGFRQEPSVVLADGKARVKVVFISDPGKKDASDLKVAGGRLLSLKKDPDYTNTWIAELRPEKGVYAVSMTVALEKLAVEFPLAVAPARNIDLDKSGKVTEADFALFLKKRGTLKKPEFDLNGDGKRDYKDEYIFTANYLAEAGKKASKK